MEDRKKAGWICIFYGFIVVLSNVIGVLIPNIFTSQDITNELVSEWARFLDDYSNFVELPQYLTFFIPLILCSIYTFSKKQSHFINLPIAYSTIGISGWAFYILHEIIMIIVAVNSGYKVDVKYILLSSWLNVIMEALIAFTLAYFVTETIHRKFVLPYFYPEGHLSKIKGVKQPSVKFLIIVNYMSVTLFPVIFLLMSYNNNLNFFGSEISKNVLIILFFILIIGLAITFSLISYFEKPLLSLKKRIKQVEEGDYVSKVNIVTNDCFGELSDIINDMTDSIEDKTQKILEIQNSVLTGMAVMVESRDNSTGGHIKRTSDCVRVFVEYLKANPEYDYISDDFCNAVIKAAPMHDLGKIAVDDAILRKPGKFTDEEYEKMKVHPEEGAKIVEKVLFAVEDEEFKKIAVNVAHYHHEKWDGKGYPSGIKGENIPFEARIMALADVFDALVSKRCYKDSFSYDKAFEIIKDSLGSHFDPKLGREFINCRKNLEELYNYY